MYMINHEIINSLKESKESDWIMMCACMSQASVVQVICIDFIQACFPHTVTCEPHSCWTIWLHIDGRWLLLTASIGQSGLDPICRQKCCCVKSFYTLRRENNERLNAGHLQTKANSCLAFWSECHIKCSLVTSWTIFKIPSLSVEWEIVLLHCLMLEWLSLLLQRGLKRKELQYHKGS